jgi:hypothetical protein
MSDSDTSSTDDNKGKKGTEDMIEYRSNIMWTSDLKGKKPQIWECESLLKGKQEQPADKFRPQSIT